VGCLLGYLTSILSSWFIVELWMCLKILGLMP
jgi:hypothetical protein